MGTGVCWDGGVFVPILALGLLAAACSGTGVDETGDTAVTDDSGAGTVTDTRYSPILPTRGHVSGGDRWA